MPQRRLRSQPIGSDRQLFPPPLDLVLTRQSSQVSQWSAGRRSEPAVDDKPLEWFEMPMVEDEEEDILHLDVRVSVCACAQFVLPRECVSGSEEQSLRMFVLDDRSGRPASGPQ